MRARILTCLLASFLLAVTASPLVGGDSNDVKVEVSFVIDDQVKGGNAVLIRTGEALLGVSYGSERNPREISIFSTYPRFIGGIDLYDDQGNFLRKEGLRVRTVFVQSLLALVEFNDTDGNKLFDFKKLEDTSLPGDYPIKSFGLRRAWVLSDFQTRPGENSHIISFALECVNSSYSLIWDSEASWPRPSQRSDGMVERIAITFQITVAWEEKEIVGVPWFKVIISGGDERRILQSEVLDTKSFDGRFISSRFKYGHDIEGWDFSGNHSRLAMETRLYAGNIIPGSVAKRIHEGFVLLAHDSEEGNESFRLKESDTPLEEPKIATRNRLAFDDDWYRIGRLLWTSDISVDGELGRTLFQVHANKPLWMEFEGKILGGFEVRGAFVYPAGDHIIHDPELVSDIHVFDITPLINMTPRGIILVQIAVAAIGLLLAIGISYHSRKKGGMK